MRSAESIVRAELQADQSTPQKDDERNRAEDVRDRDRERDPPGAEPVEGDVERRVRGQRAERDGGRRPGRLESEKRPVQHQHRAVEGEAEREGGERPCDDSCLAGFELAALVEETDDRLGEDDRDHTCGNQQEGDLAQAGTDHAAEALQVVASSEPRERREEHRRDRDREHPLRKHVDAEGCVDRARREVRVDEPRREEGPDHGREVDEAEAERDGQHEHEDALDRGVPPVDRHAEPAVEPC